MKLELIDYFTLEEGFYAVGKIAFYKRIESAEMFLNLKHQFGIFKDLKLQWIKK